MIFPLTLNLHFGSFNFGSWIFLRFRLEILLCSSSYYLWVTVKYTEESIVAEFLKDRIFFLSLEDDFASSSLIELRKIWLNLFEKLFELSIFASSEGT